MCLHTAIFYQYKTPQPTTRDGHRYLSLSPSAQRQEQHAPEVYRPLQERRQGAWSLPALAASLGHPCTGANVHISLALPQGDRFIPNRSSSNLDVASYVSREDRDLENLDALSPSKVGTGCL